MSWRQIGVMFCGLYSLGIGSGGVLFWADPALMWWAFLSVVVSGAIPIALCLTYMSEQNEQRSNPNDPI